MCNKNLFISSIGTGLWSVHIYVLFESIIIYSADLQDVRELLLVSSSAGHITRRRSRIRAARGSEFLDTDGSAYQRGH